MGLRSTYKEDLQATPSELVYGANIRLPVEMFDDEDKQVPQTEFVKIIKAMMRELKPLQTSRHMAEKPFVHKDLKSSSHIFLRNDAVRPPLKQPYKGPYEVVSRSEKTLKIRVKGRTVNVSVDRVKAAYMANETGESLTGERMEEPNRSDCIQHTPKVTRTGRIVRFPTKYTG
ncbi:uncharacterized protein LOC119665520 [Teleopsis dalmanni]|uniref:uncharacterized protein LOC119665520 n=1 Tax=Teleopsis dalmanni TaxID=139649 RepID=UPI0018CF0FAD|nr:uncharacterized protein LOC119665520 [Teleopsis dalmanni]